MMRSGTTNRRSLLPTLAAGFVVAAVILVGLPRAWGQTASSATIKFLSPTSFSGEVPTLTDDNSGFNASYRLSAWAANPPTGALVEFELVPGDALTKPITIGAGTAVFGDTFEYEWDIAEGPTGVAEGQHTLKVILYDANSEELATDSMLVNILHGSTAGTEGAASLDMAYPVSGGALGHHTGANGKINSVFDIASNHKGSWGARAFFTTSSPGTSPVWRVCNSEELWLFVSDGVRCTYPADDPATDKVNEAVDPLEVTAVGLLVTHEDGSADVARVAPYEQIPSSITYNLHPQSTSGGVDAAKAGTPVKEKDASTGLFPCSDWVRVRLTDQVGRTIAAGNLDAHAHGPSDQLRFHTSYQQPPVSSAKLQEPNQGHSLPEEGGSCAATDDVTAMQGEHSLAGRADRKHVETTAGTRDNGLFDLRLQTDQPGVTQLTVWSDVEEDDSFCSGEISFSLSLAWGSPEQPVEPEQPADCAVISGERSAGIEPSTASVLKGRNVRIVGSIDAVEPVCEVAQTLKLKAKRPAAARFRTVATAATDGFGLASFEITVERTKVYRVVAPRAGECLRERSETRTIRAI